MDSDELVKSFESLHIPKTHATVGISNLIACNKQYKSLFVNRRLPDHGWDDIQIQSFLFLLSTLDTNNKSLVSSTSTSGGGGGGDDDDDGDNNNSNDTRWCGVGEREGRVYSSLVLHRHYGLSHGMGRSGDITEPQPKAVGSSVLVKLTLLLVLDAIRRGSGFHNKTSAAHGILLPMCTGMSMSLVLSSLRELSKTEEKGKDKKAENKKSEESTSNDADVDANVDATASTDKQEDQDEGKHVERNIILWSRIDQKSCFKAITSAGFECVVVPTKLRDDEVITDIQAMEDAITKYTSKRILAIISTTSCFAPRIPDLIDEISKLCMKYNIYHVINNAYGLQCSKTCKLINRACVVGRVDAIVCSTDKNFLVPVGGAIVTSPKKVVVESIGKIYAGRASSSPIVDLFITLLSMGFNGYKRLLNERQQLVQTFPSKLEQIAIKHGERLLQCTTNNTISFGITLNTLASRPQRDEEDDVTYYKSISKDISSFGAMLFSRCVSGTRIIPRYESKTMGGIQFDGFGSSVENYHSAYMTAACAIGVSQVEINEFFHRLDKTLVEYKKKMNKKKEKAKDQETKE